MVQGGAHDAHLAPSPDKPAPKAAEKKAVPKIAKMVKVVKAGKVVAKVATAAKVVKAAQPKPTDKEVNASIQCGDILHQTSCIRNPTRTLKPEP